jgi:hypothetical protein
VDNPGNSELFKNTKPMLETSSTQDQENSSNVSTPLVDATNKVSRERSIPKKLRQLKSPRMITKRMSKSDKKKRKEARRR